VSRVCFGKVLMSQGPPDANWWLASDGRWYPPEWAAPPVPPPVSYAPGPGPGPFGVWPTVPYATFAPPATNGLAVASLVLGILWIYWIGSVLALVFGYVAMIQIRERNEGGHGLAVAGIVLGWVGMGIGFLALAIALIAACTGS